MLNSSSLNQDEIILKSSSRKITETEQIKDFESGPIYRQKRSSKRTKLSLVSNQPITQQKKLCYICRKSCETKMCKCENILYHPQCVMSQIRKSTLSLQSLQCPFCLCFFCTEIKNQKCRKSSIYRNLTLLFIIFIIILIIVMGVMWNHISIILILLIFIIILLLILCALTFYRKIRYLELQWKLTIIDNNGYNVQAISNAKLIVKAHHTQTAHYILETETS